MEQRANILFEKFLEGTCSKEELDRLMEILQQNEHEADFRSMLEKVYSEINASLYPATDGARTAIRLPETKQALRGLSHKKPPADNRSRGRIKYLTGAAACLLLALGILYFWKMNPDVGRAGAESDIAGNLIEVQRYPLPEGRYKHQKTERAEQKYLLLPDGTQVWLNAESSLMIPDQFDEHQRVVYLEGEAFFDVKHADKIPFIIHMPNHVTTKVLGTAFDIKAYGDKAFSVTVKRGKVQVSKDKKQLATLTVGQQIKMVESQNIQPLIQDVKKDNIASWTEGKLSYDASELSDILIDLERAYNVQIELKNKPLSKEIITTSFNKGDGIKEVLKTLSILTGTKLTDHNPVYIME